MFERWRAGDQAAAEVLYARYANRLIALAQAKMSSKLHRKGSPDSVAQSALKSFFLGVRDGKYEYRGKDELWGLLVRITLHKVQKRVKHWKRGVRDPDREVGDLPIELLAQDPTPQEAAELADLIDHVLTRLKPDHARIMTLRLQGHSTFAIADAVRCSERQVRRVLEKVREIIHVGLT